MKSRQIRAILSASYFHPRYAKKVAKATGARVVEMANQVEAREGVDDYLEMIDWNVRHVADALE
jgi:ABC-type Zn uptake system ZnuABC Zn-binding protein ZnuA